MIHDLDDHARRLGFRNRADMENYADALRAALFERMRRKPIDPRTAFEQWRQHARQLQEHTAE